MSALIDLYFEYVNLFNPLLHRPTFDRLLHDNMHFKDVSLAEVVLLVCALGARFSDDQRVFLDGSTLSAGCMWFKQAQEIEDRILAPASLYHIQASFVSSQKRCLLLHLRSLTRCYSYGLNFLGELILASARGQS